MRLKFLLFSAEGTSIERDAEKVLAKTSGGEVCILPNHARYFAELSEGKIRVNEEEIFTDRGFISVRDNRVLVFVNMAEAVDKVDVHEVEERIQELSSLPPEKLTLSIRKKIEWLKRLKEEKVSR